MKTKQPLERAIHAAGGRARIAAALDVTPMCVSQWRKRNRVPVQRAIAIEELTAQIGDPVYRHELRPDIWPCPLPAGGSAHQAASG